jgi:membrane protein DedA with SNARE-associated domain
MVIAVAALGAFVGDSVYFFAGRAWGPRLMRRLPALARAVPRVDRFVGRWHALAVIVLRFTYGLRIAGPVVLGAGAMKTLTFVWANALGALLWAVLLAALGWGMGQAATGLLGGIARVEHIAIGVVIAIVVLVTVVHMVTKRRLEQRDSPGGE